jgi:hypothetical protein
MIRNLFIFSGISLAVSLFALAGAAGLVRHDLAAHDWTWTIEQSQHNIHFARGAPAKPYMPDTRSLAWTDTDSLISDVPGDVVYEQGKPAGITVSGPAALVGRVRFEGGRLFLIDGDAHEDPQVITFHLGPHGIEAHANDHDRLKIEVTAPAVTHFSVASDGDLSIRDYDQPALDLSLSGDGDAHVEGATKALTLSVSGDGDAHLDDLRAGDASLNLSGDGDAVIAASGKVAINSSGNGDVTLKTSPASLISHLSGDGSVNQE